MKLTVVAIAAGNEELAGAPGAELGALDEATLQLVLADFTVPDRVAEVAAACCWFIGKMKAGPCWKNIKRTS